MRPFTSRSEALAAFLDRQERADPSHPPGPEEATDATRALLALVEALRAAGTAGQDPLPVDAGARRPSGRATSRTRRHSRAVAAGAMAVVVGALGVAVVGAQSLPGDPLYGVKRGSESWQLRFTSGDVAKGTRHLDFASTRLEEIRRLTTSTSEAPAPTSGHLRIDSGTVDLAPRGLGVDVGSG